MTNPQLHVSFICTFNRARSVMAAAMFVEQLRRRGLGEVVRVSSGGTTTAFGLEVDPRAAAALLSHNYPLYGHRCAQVGAEHLAADLVVALGCEHIGWLQKRGVDDERLRYVDVENPVRDTDFEPAFAAIEAAMPDLHRWVNERLPLAELETTIGWRFWRWTRGQPLCSPYAPALVWSSRSQECPPCRRHAAPVPNCCGWFADIDFADSLARACDFKRNSAAGRLPRHCTSLGSHRDGAPRLGRRRSLSAAVDRASRQRGG